MANVPKYTRGYIPRSPSKPDIADVIARFGMPLTSIPEADSRSTNTGDLISTLIQTN